jgi:hypothetical protein
MVFAARYFAKHLISTLTLKWEIATHEDIEEDAKGPNVTFKVVVAVEHLGRHIIRRTGNSLQFLILFCSLGEAEIY